MSVLISVNEHFCQPGQRDDEICVRSGGLCQQPWSGPAAEQVQGRQQQPLG